MSSFKKSFRGEKLVEQERSTKREFFKFYEGAENSANSANHEIEISQSF